MNLLRCDRLASALLLLSLPVFAATPTSLAGRSASLKTHHHASLKHSSAAGKKPAHASTRSPAVAMPSERATQIQTALIKQGYLKGEPTGAWDPQTVSAMEKLQADNGWQSRITPGRSRTY